jgi:regulator of protease activity HflC (stomatin/prohibitin superfamily)
MKERLVLLIGFCALLGGCTTVTTEAGYESVLIKKPIMFGTGGVVKEAYTTGREYAAPTTDYVSISVQPQTTKESFDDLITRDNNPVDFDVTVTYQIQAGKTPYLYETFGLKWYENNIKPQFRNFSRDFAKGYTMFDLTSNPATANAMEKELIKNLSDLVAKQKLPVLILNVAVGKISPPADVINETAKTAAQVQRVKTETEREKAEIARAGAERRKAEADRAYIQAFGMTNAEYLRMRELELEKERISLLRDNKNATIIFGSPTPTYSVRP